MQKSKINVDVNYMQIYLQKTKLLSNDIYTMNNYALLLSYQQHITSRNNKDVYYIVGGIILNDNIFSKAK